VSVGSLPGLLSDRGGAIERRVVELASAQVRAGHEVRAYSVGDATHTVVHNGVMVHYLRCNLVSPLSRAEFQARTLARLLTLHRWRSHVVHVHSELEIVLGRWLLNIPFLLSYDHYLFRRGRSSQLFPVYRKLLHSFDLLLPCSRYCERESRSYWRLSQERLAVLPNGVNREQFAPNAQAGREERAMHGLDRALVVLYVGRVCEQKGTDVLLEAFERIRQAVTSARLVIAGPIDRFDPPGSPIERIWQDRMRQAEALYLGVIPEGRLAATYNMADVFVMPTREWEMFGMAAVEAQACGVPVVVSDHGGLRETVPESVGGRFLTGDSESLARHVTRLLLDPAARAKCREAALRNAAQFDWDQVAAMTEDLYDRARQDFRWRFRGLVRRGIPRR
jgi:D-inositol-3-phosphate glycosyltransferase